MMQMSWTENTATVVPAPCRQIGSQEARELLNEYDALLIDVREPHEYAAGRIPDSQHIPLRQIVHRVEDLKRHGGRPIIISCRSGNRSEMACRFLRESGVENVYNLSGGVIAWLRADQELVQ